MNGPKILFVLALSIIILNSCEQEGQGFALPAGEIEAGKEAYRKFECNSCHIIAGIKWNKTADSLQIPLGGETGRMKSYGELVTSVINPSHQVALNYQKDSLGNSKMKSYNEVMTVQELVDIVTFLQSEYEIITPPQYYYPY